MRKVRVGRVVDALGRPLDGLGEIESNERRPLELQAPSVVQRQPVSEPRQAGIKACDARISEEAEASAVVYVEPIAWLRPVVVYAVEVKMAEHGRLYFAQHRTDISPSGGSVDRLWSQREG